MKERVMIAVPTFNRWDTLKKMAQSLNDSEIDCEVTLKIYDDCSTDYSVSEIQGLFTNAQIVRNEKNVGADINMYLMYKDFVYNSTADYFFNADSDLIFCRNWLNEGLELIKETDGVISLFNTTNHKGTQTDNNLVCKNIVGAAGTLFKRDILELIVHGYENREAEVKNFDWQWCRYLSDNNIRLYSVYNSLVQHIGVIGSNAGISNFDYGHNFKVDSINNGQIINDSFETYVAKKDGFISPVMVANRLFEKCEKVLFWGASSKSTVDVVKVVPEEKRGYFVDSNCEQYDEVLGLKVYSPKKLLDERNSNVFIIVISHRYYNEIKIKLEGMGYVEYVDFVNLQTFEKIISKKR